MTNDERNPKPEWRTSEFGSFRHSDFGIPSDFGIRHSDLGTLVHAKPPSLLRMHWDHEPTPSPSQEGSDSGWPVPLPGGVRGGLILRQVHEGPPAARYFPM